jgi:alkylhydroperoxidase family enzyme
MPFLKSLPPDAGPPEIFHLHPAVYKPWAEMSQELMNGESELSPGERELLLAFAAGIANCKFVYRAHSEVSFAWGIAPEMLNSLLADLTFSAVQPRLRPLFAYVRKLTLSSSELVKADADAIFEAGWNEKTFHDVVAITARMAFMQKLAEGYGFEPFSPEKAKSHAKKRVQLGYVQLYPAFRSEGEGR